MKKNYWIMKSEPDVFGIDDLANKPQQTEPWDGVRNYQVRNWIKDSMKIHDLAFFYHSSCEIPGIVGVIEIISNAYPDASAFNKNSPYYDPKSKSENPRWYSVDVKLVKKFPKIISLEALRHTAELKDLKILQKGNRLSITPITKTDFQIISNLASE